MILIQKKIERREILRWAAMATASVSIAAGCGTGMSNPDVVMPGDTSTGDATAEAGGDAMEGGMMASDAMSLNALRAAELGAIKAYDAGAMIINGAGSTDPLFAGKAVYLAVAGRFQQQHRDHAAALGAMITAMGGTPIPDEAGAFTPPMGFTPSIANVLKLACNAEKGAAVAYAQTQIALNTANGRFLAGSINGDETQHFIVLYVLLKGLAEPGTNISMVEQVVPKSFVSNLDGMMNGLQTQADFTYG